MIYLQEVEVEVMSNCEHCGKPLVPIGTSRKNGKATHNDWATRRLHKKCRTKLKDYNRKIRWNSYDSRARQG